MPRPPDPRYIVFVKKLEKRKKQLRDLEEIIGCLLILANEGLERLPSDAGYYHVVKTTSRKRVKSQVYEYEYLEVYEYAKTGSNARLACRVRVDSKYAKIVEDAAMIETYFNQLRGLLLKLRFICEQLLEFYHINCK